MSGMSELNSMTTLIAHLAASAEEREIFISPRALRADCEKDAVQPPQSLPQNLPAHSFPATLPGATARTAEKTGDRSAVAAGRASRGLEDPSSENRRSETPVHAEPWLPADEFHAREQERRTYRGRTVAMLRRYMRYSIETGRLPSVLGREFFRAKVTSYRVGTFEDRVIFVHDMETCLERLDEFSRELIARHILQEHDRCATAKLLHCNEKTVRRLTPLALDLLSEILLDRGLLEKVESMQESLGKNSCQGGRGHESIASDCEQDK
jgi:DNA-directed RNA polymerase specialized sigma24 family protein